jgi:hypothetical protein
VTASTISGIVSGKQRGEDRYALWIEGEGYLIFDLLAGVWPDKGAVVSGIVRSSRDGQTVRDDSTQRSIRIRIVRGGLSRAEARQALRPPVSGTSTAVPLPDDWPDAPS